MDDAYLLLITREAIYLILLLSAPAVLAALLIGLVTSVFQASTQLQDHAIGFVPKLIGVLLALALTAPFIGSQLVRFTTALFEGVPHVGG